MSKPITYDMIIQELNTKALSKRTLPTFIDHCSQAIDDIGCKLMKQFEENLAYTPDMLNLKRQQKKLINMRDILFTTYNDIQYDLKPTAKRNNTAFEGVAREYIDVSSEYTWTI